MTTDNLHVKLNQTQETPHTKEQFWVTGSWVFDGSIVVPRQTNSGASLVPSTEIALPGAQQKALWAPGFIDIQVNGYKGVDYSGTTLTYDGIDSIITALAPSGTTRHVPTIITNNQERICRNLEFLHKFATSSLQRRLALPGLHVEGPYISPEDGPRGAHDLQFVRDPSWSEVSEWISAADGDLKMVTLAPERPGAIPLIEQLVAHGIIVALGHTAGESSDIHRAVAAGARLSTHLGNGSHAMLPRLKNYLWTQMAEDALVAGLITDGFHLPSDAMKSIIRAKQSNRIILVSDVAPLAGTPPGKTKWGRMEVQVHPDGHISLADTTFLAGAGHLLNHNLGIVVSSGALTMAEAITACTNKVLEIIPVESYASAKNPVNPTDYRDFVRFIPGQNSESLEVTHVIRGGEFIYQTESKNLGATL